MKAAAVGFGALDLRNDTEQCEPRLDRIGIGKFRKCTGLNDVGTGHHHGWQTDAC